MQQHQSFQNFQTKEECTRGDSPGRPYEVRGHGGDGYDDDKHDHSDDGNDDGEDDGDDDCEDGSEYNDDDATDMLLLHWALGT